MRLIAVDIDNVLGDTAEFFVEYSNTSWGCNIKVSDYNENFALMWNTDKAETFNRFKQIYDDPENFATIQPRAGALYVLRRLAEKYRLVTLSSRPINLSEVTNTWLEYHFPDVFSRNIYSGIYDVDDSEKSSRLHHSKGEILRSIGADYLIDDEPKHCIGALECGVQPVMFGRYAWNRDYSGYIQCNDWASVEEFFRHEET